MPNVVLEAMASGLAVAATSVPGTIELVKPGRTGWIFPVDDPHELARVLDRAVADGDARRRMGRGNRELVEKEYSWRRTAEAYLGLLQSAARL